MQSVVILGAGRTGQTLGYLLQHSGKYQIAALCNRTRLAGQQAAKFIGGKIAVEPNLIQAAGLGKIIFITTPDDVIKNLCCAIACRKGFRKSALVIHCSGNFSSRILSSAQRLCGCQIASLHPLQSFARPAEAVSNSRGIYCAYEGTDRALPKVRRLIKDLGGIPMQIRAENKSLYHAAGVIASNYLVTLLATARDFLMASGFDKPTALLALMPLVKGTIKNIDQLGIPAALTGPIARGDVSTIRNHLTAIRQQLKPYLPFYQTLGRHTITVAQNKGNLSRNQIQALRRLFE